MEEGYNMKQIKEHIEKIYYIVYNKDKSLIHSGSVPRGLSMETGLDFIEKFTSIKLYKERLKVLKLTYNDFD